MKLPELISQCAPNVDFGKFLKPSQLPPPEVSSLALRFGVVQERKMLRTAIEGDHYQLLQFRDKPASINSFSERAEGEIWHVQQIQGFRGKIGYRITTSMAVPKLFAHQLKALAIHPDSEVKAITMPGDSAITNLMDSEAYRLGKEVLPERHYRDFQAAMGMKWSPNEKLWIMEV